MTKIITFSWVDPGLFEKHNCPLRNNEEMEVRDDMSIDMALAQAKEILKSGLNAMVYNLPERKIIWVAADDKRFQQR